MTRALKHAPRLQLALDGFEIALEKYVVHNPAVEETLRDDPQQYPQPLVLEEISHDAHTRVDGEEEQVIAEDLQRIA